MRFPKYVYAIRHNVTNRIYIGSSENVDRRLRNHMCDLRAGRHKIEDMQEDYNKYGENFTFTVLDTVDNWDDRNKEYKWMEAYQSHIRGVGYNYKDKKFHHPANIYVDFCGERVLLSDLAKISGIPYGTLHSRVVTLGWDVERAVNFVGGTTNTMHKTTGQKLRELRGRKTKAEVAKLLDVSYSSYDKYERNERVPSDDVKRRIAKLYKCNIMAIFFH